MPPEDVKTFFKNLYKVSNDDTMVFVTNKNPVGITQIVQMTKYCYNYKHEYIKQTAQKYRWECEEMIDYNHPEDTIMMKFIRHFSNKMNEEYER